MRLTYVVAESDEQFNCFKDSKKYRDKGCCIRLTDSCQIRGQSSPEVVVLSKDVPNYVEIERVVKLTKISKNEHHLPLEILPKELYL